MRNNEESSIRIVGRMWMVCILLLMVVYIVLSVLRIHSTVLIGTYAAESYDVEETYEFGLFGRVVYSMGNTYTKGTYKIEGDKITFDFEGVNLVASALNDTFDFAKNRDSIEIDGDTYKKIK